MKVMILLQDHWLLIVVGLLLILLITMRSKRTGRSALYSSAVGVQRGICLAAAVLPTIATVIEEIPERFVRAWQRERGESRLEVMRPGEKMSA